MRKIFTILSFACIPFLVEAQKQPQVFLDFDHEQIPQMEGLHIVDGTGDILIKKGVNEGTYSQIPNEIVTDNDQKVLFMDYEGYLGFDENLINKNHFTFAASYKWTGQEIWWLGLFNIVGFHQDRMITDPENPDNEINEPAWVSPKLQIKAPTGLLEGYGISTEDNTMKSDSVYHLAATYNEGAFKLYIDGELKGETAAEDTLNYHTYSNFQFYVGAKIDVDSETGDLFMSNDGSGNSKSTQVYIDNVTLYDTVLNDAEILQLAQGGPSGIKAEFANSQNKVRIFPNPAKDKFSINAENVSNVNIYSLSGIKVLSRQNVDKTVNINTLSEGLYVVQCLDSKGNLIANQRLIVQ